MVLGMWDARTICSAHLPLLDLGIRGHHWELEKDENGRHCRRESMHDRSKLK
jgi:hypothetical protein